MALERPVFPPITAADRELLNPFTRTREPQEGDDGPFRIGELSRRSGVAVGTIKYYLREGLLPVGQPTAKTQALYTRTHLERLRLVRVLAEVGGLSIAQIRSVIDLLDTGSEVPGELVKLVAYSIARSSRGAAERARETENDPAAWESAKQATDAFIGWLGLEVDPEAPARLALADALHALRLLGIADNPLVFFGHARIAYDLAEFEASVMAPVKDGEPRVEATAVGGVVFGKAFMALRSLALEHETRRLRLVAAQAQSEAQSAPPSEADGDAPS